jgi:SAM-dependent methyltransferase
MTDATTNDVRVSYDRVADEYVQRISDELKGKPLDRALLDRLASSVTSPLCDMGCGPGQVGRYLHERGAQVVGVDLSPGLVEYARRLNPGIEFRVGDMRALDFGDDTFGGMAAFYSLIHIPPQDMPQTLRELWRVLRPGGLLLLAFHIGDQVLHLDEWWGHAVCLDFRFFQPAAITAALEQAGFVIEEVIERDPYPDVEHQSRRAYIFARKTAQL